MANVLIEVSVNVASAMPMSFFFMDFSFGWWMERLVSTARALSGGRRGEAVTDCNEMYPPFGSELAWIRPLQSARARFPVGRASRQIELPRRPSPLTRAGFHAGPDIRR